MTWRKWLVRGLVYSVMAGGVLVYLAYQYLTNPVATRRQVLEKLAEKFIGASATLESARLNLFDGISLSELRLARRDDLDRTDFLYVPSATLYHDKEQLLHGKLALRKLVLKQPQLRVLFHGDGRCNLMGLLCPSNPQERLPTVVVQDGTLVLEDRRLDVGKPIVEIRNVNLTLLNDPLPQLVVEGDGLTDVLGAVKVTATLQRVGGALTAGVGLSDIPVGPALVQRLASFAPDVAVHLRQLRGGGKVQATLSWQPEANPPLGLELTGQLTDGWFNHARLPAPLEKIEASVRCVNDPIPPPSEPVEQTPASPPIRPPLLNLRVPLATITANQAGSTRLEAAVRDFVIPPAERESPDDSKGAPAVVPPGGGEPAGPHRHDGEWPVRELTWKVQHLPVTPDLFRYLPEAMQEINTDYKPCGPVSVSHRYERERPGQWRKTYLIEPEGMEAECIRFPYPVEAITGQVERTTGSDNTNRITIDLAGRGGDRPVTFKGLIEGERATSGVDLTISADNVPMDEKLQRALPPKSQVLAAQFHPEGLADIRAHIYRTRGTRDFANRYEVAVHRATVKYDLFPYRLEGVTGMLTILPDHWECRDFCGFNQGGEIRVQGRSFAVEPAANGEPASKIRLLIHGKDVPINKEFEEALSPPGMPGRAALQRTVKTLELAGRLNFASEVLDIPNQPQDIDVTVSVRGCSMKPKFFEYTLNDVAGTVRYAHERVDLSDVQARHGTSLLRIKQGQVLLRSDEGFQVRLPSLHGAGVVPDADFLAALPPVLRKGLATLQLRGPFDVTTALVVDQKEMTRPPVIWWDGGARLKDAVLVAGVEVKDARGTVHSLGEFNGQELNGMVGTLDLEQASVMGQPLRNVRCRVEVDPDNPGTLRFRDISADLFGGVVGGEGRLDLYPQFKYDLVLKALGVKLEEFGKHNLGAGTDLEGLMAGAVHLTGDGMEVGDLKGNGQMEVPSGKLYRLPLLLDLLKALGLRKPDGTAFEEARMTFAIDSGKMQVLVLDLIGNAISLRGQGTANLDGTNLNLDFSADWGRFGMLPHSITLIPQAISDQLLRIKMRGKLGDVRFEKELVPGVVEPVKKMLGSKQ
jgi:hypothetical protein